MKSNDKEHWYYNILKLLKLELTTPHGRINLAGIVLLAACVLLYSASDLVKHFISAAADTAKTIALGKDIYHPYETSSVFKAVLPVLLGLGLCLLFLHFHERKKDIIRNKEGNELD